MLPWMPTQDEAGLLAVGGSGGAVVVGPNGGVATVGGTGGIPTVSVDSSGNVTTSGLNTSAQATSAREAAGAQAAMNLAQNGYDPNNPADNAALVSAIAGACCLVPGIGPVLGAAVAALYAVGQVIATGLCKLGVFDCREYCHSSGGWTAGQWSPPPGLAAGSPQAALWPLVAECYASYANCKPNVAIPALYQGFEALWNQCFDGSSQETFAVYTPLYDPPPGAANEYWGADSSNPGPYSQMLGPGSAAPGQGMFVWLTVNAGPITAYGRQALSAPSGPSNIRMQGGPVVGGTFAGAGAGVQTTITPPTSSATKAVLAGGGALAVVALLKPSLLKGLGRWLKV